MALGQEGTLGVGSVLVWALYWQEENAPLQRVSEIGVLSNLIESDSNRFKIKYRILSKIKNCVGLCVL